MHLRSDTTAGETGNPASPDHRGEQPAQVVESRAQVGAGAGVAGALADTTPGTPPLLTPQLVLAVQRLVGNRAVASTLAERPARPCECNAPGTTGLPLPSAQTLRVQFLLGNGGPGESSDPGPDCGTAPAISERPITLQRVGPTVTAEGDSIVFEQRTLSDDPQQVRATVERAIEEDGWENADAWAYRLINRDKMADSLSSNPKLIANISDRLKSEMDIKQNALTQLLGPLTDLGDVVFGGAGFEGRATDVTKTVLDNSEKQLKAEAEHYGLKVDGYIFKSYSMAGGPLQAGLQDAARALAPKRREADVAGDKFMNAQKSAQQTASLIPNIPSNLLTFPDTLRTAWMAAEDAFHQLAQDKQKDFPILATFTTADGAAAKLDEVASMGTTQLAETLYKTIDDRMTNIQTVRDEIGVRYSIWKQPQIVALTKQQMALAGWESRVVDEKVQKVHADDEADAKVWAAVALGLGLLAAIPTGGSSLLAGIAAAGATLGAAYSLNTLYEHYKQYGLEVAEGATDFDKARSIAQSNPSLIWLAFDLLDLGLNLAGAATAFKTLQEAVALAKQTQAADDLVKVVEDVRAAKLKPDSQSRLIADAMGGATNPAKLQATLDQVAEVFKRLQPADKDSRLAKAMQDSAAKLIGEGKVAVLSNDPGQRAKDIADLVKANVQDGSMQQYWVKQISAKYGRTTPPYGTYYRKLGIIVLRGDRAPKRLQARWPTS